jgi:ornithine cyclodeaminase
MMTSIFTAEAIRAAVQPAPELVDLIEAGFVRLEAGQVVAPAPTHLAFDHPPGDVRIKPGYLRGDDVYVIRIASGFYENPARGLPSSDGLMLVHQRQTGELLAILHDRGYLTNLRTAAAGAAAARRLAPPEVTAIGIIGAGTQARLQLQFLRWETDCRQVVVRDIQPQAAESFADDVAAWGFTAEVVESAAAVAARCNLIVTATPAHKAILMHEDIRAGTHITAVGADSEGKQELDPRILRDADLILVDGYDETMTYGEVATALKRWNISPGKIWSFGGIISKGIRRAPEHITVADLTGVSIQDVQIAKLALERLHASAAAID